MMLLLLLENALEYVSTCYVQWKDDVTDQIFWLISNIQKHVLATLEAASSNSSSIIVTAAGASAATAAAGRDHDETTTTTIPATGTSFYENGSATNGAAAAAAAAVVPSTTASTSTSPALLPMITIALCCLFLWPLILSLLVTLISAWYWIFWLLTCIIVGLVQVAYSTYQFIMITFDIMGLSILKTYSTLRRYILVYIAGVTADNNNNNRNFTENNNGANRNKIKRRYYESRRRYWRRQLEQANSYEDFLKIKIETKEKQQDQAHKGEGKGRAGSNGRRRRYSGGSSTSSSSSTYISHNSDFDGRRELVNDIDRNGGRRFEEVTTDNSFFHDQESPKRQRQQRPEGGFVQQIVFWYYYGPFLRGIQQLLGSKHGEDDELDAALPPRTKQHQSNNSNKSAQCRFTTTSASRGSCIGSSLVRSSSFANIVQRSREEPRNESNESHHHQDEKKSEEGYEPQQDSEGNALSKATRLAQDVRHRGRRLIVRRNRSFNSGLDVAHAASKARASGSEKEVDPAALLFIDPHVVEELGGGKVAQLLMTTTAKLKKARTALQHQHDEYHEQQQQYQSHDENHNIVGLDSSEGNSNINSNSFSSIIHEELEYLLTGVVKRNHLTLEDMTIENARSVYATGRHLHSQPSRQLIRAYYEEVENCLHYIAESPTTAAIPTQHTTTTTNTNATPTATTNTTSSSTNPSTNHHATDDRDAINDPHPLTTVTAAAEQPPLQPLPPASRISQSLQQQQQQQQYSNSNMEELIDRITLVRKMKQNMGRTALMFSGGGAQAMYHFGMLRALIESQIYKNIKVISGTSGGSIAAAICAIHTEHELINELLVSTVSTDYPLGSGIMKQQNIRWFPTIIEMGTYWLKNKLLVDSAYFKRTCEYYFKNITFEEAFIKTGKHVCITVSASRASNNNTTAQRLLLNHISTPHVTIASAVTASCALPGVMAPAKLETKNSNGILEPFEVDGVEWIDGSVQADLPFQRISTLFAVTSFIVSQTNFHIVPFLHKAHHPNSKSLYWKIFQTLEWDIRNRALKLSRLGLFPKIFGQDISKVFKQRYHGNLTIVPQFTTMQTFGLQALCSPTVKDMEGYLKYGQIATWPYLNAIRTMIRLETSLDECLNHLETRIKAMHAAAAQQYQQHQSSSSENCIYAPPSDYWSNHNDEVESIASGSFNNNNGTAGGHHHQRVVKIVGRPWIASNSCVPPLHHVVAGSSTTLSEKDRQRLTLLEEENQALRLRLEKLEQLLSSPPSLARGASRSVNYDVDEGAEAAGGGRRDT